MYIDGSKFNYVPNTFLVNEELQYKLYWKFFFKSLVNIYTLILQYSTRLKLVHQYILYSYH